MTAEPLTGIQALIAQYYWVYNAHESESMRNEKQTQKMLDMFLLSTPLPWKTPLLC